MNESQSSVRVTGRSAKDGASIPPSRFASLVGTGFWIRSTAVGIALAAVLAWPGLADEATLATVQGVLGNFRSQHGHAPTDKDFLEAIADHITSLDTSERRLLWEEVATLQKAQISAQDLAQLSKSKTESLHDMRQQYKVRREEFDHNGHVTNASEHYYEFIFSGNKVLLGKDHNLKDKRGPDNSSVKSYDGECVRLVDFRKTGRSHGSVNYLQSRQEFYAPTNVLVASMLINTDRQWQTQHEFHDLAFLALKPNTVVLEKTEKVGQSDCVVIANLACRVFLDPTRDFSVVRVEEYAAKNDGKTASVQRFVTGLRTFESLKHYGNGIWLPGKVEQVVFNEGRPIVRETTFLKSAAINAGVDDGVFSNVFPPDAMVSDGIRHTTYRLSDAPSIEGTLAEAVVGKLKWSTVLLLLNIIAIVVIVAFLAHRQLRIAKTR